MLIFTNVGLAFVALSIKSAQPKLFRLTVCLLIAINAIALTGLFG